MVGCSAGGVGWWLVVGGGSRAFTCGASAYTIKNIYTNIYIYIYICVYMIYVCIYIYIYVYIYVRVYRRRLRRGIAAPPSFAHHA